MTLLKVYWGVCWKSFPCAFYVWLKVSSPDVRHEESFILGYFYQGGLLNLLDPSVGKMPLAQIVRHLAGEREHSARKVKG